MSATRFVGDQESKCIGELMAMQFARANSSKNANNQTPSLSCVCSSLESG